jgi:hypothetical protein
MVRTTTYPTGDWITRHYQGIRQEYVQRGQYRCCSHCCVYSKSVYVAFFLHGATQSWLHGKFIEMFEPDAVALLDSNGYESPKSKFLMRLTSLVSDALIYFPACVACASFLYSNPSERLLALTWMLMNPALIMIDHGHFQYNSISLGFTVCF